MQPTSQSLLAIMAVIDASVWVYYYCTSIFDIKFAHQHKLAAAGQHCVYYCYRPCRLFPHTLVYAVANVPAALILLFPCIVSNIPFICLLSSCE